MRDGPIRRVIKLAALIRYSIDLRVTRAIQDWRDPPRFELRGDCGGCGSCCEAPSIPVHPIVTRLGSLRALLLAWHRHINGFVFESEDREAGILSFRCTHFDPQTRRCDSYSSRPGMCRDYPRNLLRAVRPELFERCGYRIVDANAAGLRAALAAEDLPDEVRARLERELYLGGEPAPEDV